MLIETVSDTLFCEVVIADFVWGSELCKELTHYITRVDGETHAICQRHIEESR